MGTLAEIAEIFWKQIGGGSDESRVEVDEINARARYEYANQMWLLAWKEKKEDGSYTVPSEILVPVTKKIVNDKVDISDLGILRAIPLEMWLQSVGPIEIDCRYIKSTLNLSKILVDDDGLSENDKPFYVVGNTIYFPKGANEKEVEIIYASNGEGIDSEEVYISESVGALVMQRLSEMYIGKIAPADTTNNSNSNT